MKALIVIAYTTIAIFLSACDHYPSPTLNYVHIFTHAQRTSVAADDPLYHSVMSFRGCTAFWVKNTAERYLVMTARHCVNYRMTDACKNGLEFYEPTGTQIVATCKNVLIAAEGSDFALLEVRPTSALTQLTPLQLSARAPTLNTRLELIGFPGDSTRRLTRTGNCMVRSAKPQTYKNDYEHVNDKQLLHNCSTWAGNSGGPILKENSNVVLGMPTSYRLDRSESSPSPSDTRDDNELARMGLMSVFVHNHQHKLKSFGITVYSN